VSARPLADAEIELFARQIIVPGIGAAGQARLCAGRVALAGEIAGVNAAERWLRALGCSVVRIGADGDLATEAGRGDEHAGFDCSILAGVRIAGAAEGLRAVAPRTPLVWYALDGAHLAAGVVAPDTPLPDFHSVGAFTPAPAPLHQVAACDAAATAAALILGWDDIERDYEVDLA
jgi:hypothetical protein